MDRKCRWMLQIYWHGKWKTIMEHNERHVLVQYADSNTANDVNMRIIDALEEEKRSHGRRD